MSQGCTSLKGLRLRLKRAKLHLDAFERQTARFCSNVPYDVITERDFGGPNQLLRYKLKVERKPPPRLSLVAGDCIHNLRSVVDNTVWQLGSLSGCSKSKLGNMAFPVCITSSQFDKAKASISCLPQAAIRLIESLQPYQATGDPKSHPLYILNRLWNNDKHQSPALILATLSNTQLVPMLRIIDHPDGRSIAPFMAHGITIQAGGKAEDGREVASVTLRGDGPEPQFDVRVAFAIAFEEPGPAKGKHAATCLRTLYGFVRDEVLARFEPIFPR